MSTANETIRPTCEGCGFHSPGASEPDHLHDGWTLRDVNGPADLCDECSSAARNDMEA